MTAMRALSRYRQWWQCRASLLVNHFKFRTDIESYNLGGMGCGNGESGQGSESCTQGGHGLRKC